MTRGGKIIITCAGDLLRRAGASGPVDHRGSRPFGREPRGGRGNPGADRVAF
jgi:hypothetical protein